MSQAPPFELLLFGGNGDLAMRKLLPALYSRECAGDLPPRGRILGLGRQPLTRDEYVAMAEQGCREFVPHGNFDEKTFRQFAARLGYLRLDARQPADFGALRALMEDSPAEVRVFYLATAPDLFSIICRHLSEAGLATPGARVVLEKPLGRDLASAQKINAEVGSVFDEGRIFRIDHYLGKEPVQNLMALRFGNAFFEPLWTREWVKDVQITIAETMGVEGRGEFYDKAGALRDMVQSHLLQLLCAVALEPPASIDPDAVRDEKLKVLRALKPITHENVLATTVRGQYRAGAAQGQPVNGYLEEEGIGQSSQTETFVALKVEIGTWRWAGVPFFLRTGKRLQEKLAEIVVNFRSVPHALFPVSRGALTGNRLVIRLQPEEDLKLFLLAKAPGEGQTLRPAHLDLDFAEQFQERPMAAYERLLMDVLRGKLTLFMRRDEVDAAWRWTEPILRGWETSGEQPKQYTAGSWGPAASSALLAREGAAWHEES